MYGKYTLFYEFPKNWGYYVHTQCVPDPLLGGGGGGGKGPGDEASNKHAIVRVLSSKYSKITNAPKKSDTHILCVWVLNWYLIYAAKISHCTACIDVQLFEEYTLS